MPAHSPDIETIEDDGLYAAVLAAGASTRFGGRKQLADFRGRPLAANAIRTAESLLGPRSMLVVGCDWQNVHVACAPLAGFLIRNERYASGMASSIAAAARALPSQATGLLLLLADQALIGVDELRELRRAWQKDRSKIVCCEFGGLRGPPCIFPRALFAELAALEGDRGARVLVERHADQVVSMPCAEAAIDIDTPEDLSRLTNAQRVEKV